MRAHYLVPQKEVPNASEVCLGRWMPMALASQLDLC